MSTLQVTICSDQSQFKILMTWAKRASCFLRENNDASTFIFAVFVINQQHLNVNAVVLILTSSHRLRCKGTQTIIRMDSMEMEGLVTKVDFQRRKQPSRCVSVCLGLLCAVLLAGNIGQFIYYEIIGRLASADPTQASLQFQVGRLQAKMSNLTEEKGQLQQSYTALTTERDEFRASFNNLTNERDQLQTSYYTLKQENDQLQTSYNNSHNNLTASKDQLQTNNRNLQREKDEFQTLSISLRANRDQLQSNCSSMKINKDQLQASYNTLKRESDQLQTSYNNMQKSLEELQANHKNLTATKDQLQTNNRNLQTEKEELQNKYNSLIRVKDELEKEINKFRGKPCESGWRKFQKNCYFLSTEQKNWTLSRADCITRGGDLAIIDSRDEQAFVNGIVPGRGQAWIGLTDSVTERTWMWVDGTPVTTTFWQKGQPNNKHQGQDCGEIMQRSSGVGEWNDEDCLTEQKFICEQ